MPGIAVYTAIFGGRDLFKERPEGDFDSFLFTDKPFASARTQVVVMPPPIHGDPIRSARFVKTSPQLFVPDHEVTLWLDGTLHLLEDPAAIAARYLADSDIVTNKHPERSCIYDEAAVCAQYHKDVPEKIWNQVNRYLEMGYQKGKGLSETSAVLRKNTPEIVSFNEAWWSEISLGSRRDQLSFDFLVWKLGIKRRHFSGDCFRWSPHGRD